MPLETPVRNDILSRPNNIRRGKNRLRLTWKEAIKKNLKEWNISKEFVLGMSTWMIAIHVQ
jgi:hypothetical protein